MEVATVATAFITIILLLSGGDLVATRLWDKGTAFFEPDSTQAASVASAPLPDPQVIVSIGRNGFTPSTLRVRPGTTVIWTNADSVNHTVTSDASFSGLPIDSGTLLPGQSYSLAFTGATSFSYHCSMSASMRGLVIVTK